MPELDTEYETRRTASQRATESRGLEPLPARTLARRRLLYRYCGPLTFVIGLGLSVIPGPKGSSHTVETKTEHGLTTQIHKYAFTRGIGVPFRTGTAVYGDDAIDNIRIEGHGFFGNCAVALGIVMVGAVVVGRRRRDD